MPRIALSISILLLLFAGTFGTIFANHIPVNLAPRSPALAIPAGDTRVGIDCGLGTTQAVLNGTGYPLAPSEVNPGTAVAQTSCTWMGDAGQTSTGSNDGTTEPLVTDQDESLSLSSSDIGGGFTANVILIQNGTAYINGFDLQLQWNPAVLHAVEFDQTSEPSWTPNVLLTVVKNIDNVNGVAELAQVISNTAPGNFTLFRIRFDVIGVGISRLHLVEPSGVGLTNPTPVIHSIIDGAFDSETFFDPGHTINWSASFTNSTPIVPGSPSTFQATVSGGTSPYTYGWQFDSCNQVLGTACTFKSEATGNPATITMPTTVPGFRVDLEINDSASHSIHLVHTIPFGIGTMRDSTSSSNTFAVNTVQTLNGIWLGGVPPYTVNARFCPGTGTTSNIICTLPNPNLIDSAPTQMMRENVTYKLSGVYTDTLVITDNRTPSAGGADTATVPMTVNVTGAPQAYTIAISESPTSPIAGFPVSITAKIVYATGYLLNFESSAFSYTISFGDGTTMPATSGTASFTTTHSYSSSGNFTIRVTAREISARAVSQIQETGYASVSVQPLTGFDYSLSVNPSQASIAGGGSTSAVVSVTAAGSIIELVGLHAIYSISGVTVAFSPTSGAPSYSSTMTITSQTSTPNGSYAITIIGNSTSGVIRQTTFMLLIGPQSSNKPIIGVFSAHYGKASFTDTSLVAGSKFYVQVNVTNAPVVWNGYEFALYYDQRYINVTSYDVSTNTVFLNPIITPGTYNAAGALRLSVVNQGAATTTTGMLVNITFTVLKSGGVSPLILAPGTAQTGPSAGAPPAICGACPSGAPNWSRLLASSNIIDVTTTSGYFNDAGGNPGPVASFTYSPANPLKGQTVTFNATTSYDPDNSNALNHGILEYMWDFGTTTPFGNETTFSPVITHVFKSTGSNISAISGNFTVRLTVIDSDNGFEGMSVIRLMIIFPIIHDVAVTRLTTYPSSIPEGVTIQFSVTVVDLGTVTETFNLTVVYGPLNQTLFRVSDAMIFVGESPYQSTFYGSLNTTGLTPGNYTMIAQITDKLDINPSNNALTTLFQVTPLDEPPVASFTYTPANPVAGSPMLFNATASSDPDGRIMRYLWNFGYAGEGDLSTLPYDGHTYYFPGNYTVTLTVTDNSFLTASTSMIVDVQPTTHDVRLISVNAFPNPAVSGQTVMFRLGIDNTGTLDSIVNATIVWGGEIVTTATDLVVVSSDTTQYFDVSWNTTGVAPGNYIVGAGIILPGDPSQSDNFLRDGPLLLVLPPPVLSATPNNGSIGTTVTLHGSVFPSQPFGSITNEFEITFDNQFIGYAFGNTTFTFTFNVPTAQPGPHSIHAIELLYVSLLDVRTTFTVTAVPNTIGVSVTTGTVYFPSDTATVFVQTSLNGAPTTVTSLQAILVKPGNTNTSLTLTLLTTGVYKATYTIPPTGPVLGTYAIIIKAHQTGANDGQSLTTFEVKLSWLSSQGKNITAGIAITGLVGVAAIAWRKGYFKRKDEEDGDGTISASFATPRPELAQNKP